MTVEEGARLRAARGGKSCRHPTVVEESLTSGERTGAHICTTCGELLSVSSLTTAPKPLLSLPPTFRPLRRFRRLPVHFPAWAWLEGERHGIRATCVSLSVGGAAFHCEQTLQPGMSGQFVVVIENGRAVLIDFGSIQWTSACEFGVQFIAMPEEDHARLQQYLSLHLEVLHDRFGGAAQN